MRYWLAHCYRGLLLWLATALLLLAALVSGLALDALVDRWCPSHQGRQTP